MKVFIVTHKLKNLLETNKEAAFYCAGIFSTERKAREKVSKMVARFVEWVEPGDYKVYALSTEPEKENCLKEHGYPVEMMENLGAFVYHLKTYSEKSFEHEMIIDEIEVDHDYIV